MHIRPTSVLFATLLLAAARSPAADYVILLDGGESSPLRPAAAGLAEFRHAEVVAWDVADDAATLALLKQHDPRYVVFAAPPERIDVDLAHRVLALSTQIDDDPFADFEYGFLTGRDGDAALRFVERGIAAAKRSTTPAAAPAPESSPSARGAVDSPQRKAALFGTWEGWMLPSGPLPALAALGFDARQHFVRASDKPDAQAASAAKALRKMAGCDALLFFSHGYPDRMVGCFTAPQLREWKIDLSPAVLVNCACYNGAPGRWFEISPTGGIDRGVVAAEESVALALLDSGVSAYFGGIDPWHGPLANQLFGCLTDDGLTQGGAAKRMYDRLALEFLPDRIAYPPTREYCFTGEGKANRRRNGAGMIFYGDPATAPFAAGAPHLLSATASEADGRLRVVLESKPIGGRSPGADFMLAQARLMDYYTLGDGPQLQLFMEAYGVVTIAGAPPAGLRAASATCGKGPLAVGAPQVVAESYHGERRLHVRVPIPIPIYGDFRSMAPMTQGIRIELEEIAP